MIHQTVSMSGIKLNEIDAFAVTRGPGSFTGLRIGLSCVKGLAYALNKPVVQYQAWKFLPHRLWYPLVKILFLSVPFWMPEKKKSILPVSTPEQ
jgi:tRNA threonylcarbamoyl adenosine modification protein YeaZ